MVTWALAKQVVIANDLGMHARSAAAIAKLAQEAKSSIIIGKGSQSADATSIVDILSLMCPKGTTITVSVEDPSDEEVLNRIVALVEDGFGE